MAFDELVDYLAKIRQNFPKVEHYEFRDTNLHSLNQINALATVQVLVYYYICSLTYILLTTTSLFSNIGKIRPGKNRTSFLILRPFRRHMFL